MNLVSVAERMAAIERSEVTLDARRCLHSSDRYSACQACFGVCPVSAIEPGKPPTLNAAACQSCLACLPACPAGAFTADDAIPALLNCAARVEVETLELVCARHARADTGLPQGSTAIRVRGCLAGLGVSAYLGLAALGAPGAHSVVVRTDACGECAWSSLQSQIEDQVAQAQRLLTPWDKAQFVSATGSAPPAELAVRPVIDADNPPLSRRDVFRLASRRGQVMAARAMTETDARDARVARQPARERQRLLNAMAGLPARAVPAPVSGSAGPGWAMLHVTNECSACEACARTCPTGALTLQRVEPPGYQLTFQPQRCTGCDACRHVCAPAAISLDRQPAFDDIFGAAEPVVLSQGGLVKCQRCGVQTAAAAGKPLCPACEFRRVNPFGTMPIPGLAKERS